MGIFSARIKKGASGSIEHSRPRSKVLYRFFVLLRGLCFLRAGAALIIAGSDREA